MPIPVTTTRCILSPTLIRCGGSSDVVWAIFADLRPVHPCSVELNCVAPRSNVRPGLKKARHRATTEIHPKKPSIGITLPA